MAKIHWQGSSLLDGKPIMSAFTGFERMSVNRKTGDVLQQWVLRSDVHPVEAVKSGDDVSICGDCPLRGNNGKDRLCYVTVYRAPANVYKSAVPQINQPWLDPDEFSGRVVRLGAYGDPAAIPTEHLTAIKNKARAVIGYTHQWRSCDPELKNIVMASCSSEQDRHDAKSLGWATFRVKAENDPVLPGEFPCPASVEQGSVMSCKECRRCAGVGNRDVVINVHGSNKPLLFERLKNSGNL